MELAAGGVVALQIDAAAELLVVVAAVALPVVAAVVQTDYWAAELLVVAVVQTGFWAAERWGQKH